ncbi:MAG: hypothetical protein JO093_12145 [Acidobacteria bacterium]|nr:hypothetical protein [Acidobacteriota bacterium]
MSVGRLAASDDDFYQRLYQRGMTHFAAADYASAFTELRSAAFGFVERGEQFEIAQSYAAIAAHRLGHDSDARDSLMRLVTAEKVQPRYRSIKLPDDVRAELNTLAANFLMTDEAALLGVTSVAKPETEVPTPTKQPNVALTAPRDGGPDASQPVTPAPVPQPKKPVPQPVPQPVPPPQPKSAAPQPVVPAPQPAPAPPPKPPAPQPAVPAPQPQVREAVPSLADAQRAVDSGDIDRARAMYDELSTAPALSHDTALRVAEGLYRVRDYAGAARTFARAGAIGRGEEGYHYYYAVALYETGHYGNAKRELAAALPYIAVTPDVTRYRAKIEGAIE